LGWCLGCGDVEKVIGKSFPGVAIGYVIPGEVTNSKQNRT
jgi:hypothetical protein